MQSTQPPGGSLNVSKVVHTPAIPPNPDVVLLVDTTTSMGPVIANVQANLTGLMNQVLTAQPTAQFAVADYKDTADPIPPFRVLQGLTGDVAAVQAGVNQLTPLSRGGTDAPEDGLNGLFQLATGAVNFRPTELESWSGSVTRQATIRAPATPWPR